MVSVDDPASTCQKLAGTKDDQISISSEMSIDSVKHSSRAVVGLNCGWGEHAQDTASCMQAKTLLA